jgi:hypothetical protein
MNNIEGSNSVSACELLSRKFSIPNHAIGTERGVDGTVPVNPQLAAEPLAAERHWSPAQVAEIWGFGPETIRRIFQNEPGVVVMTKPAKKNRQQHRTIRIPQTVLERVHRRLQKSA